MFGVPRFRVRCAANAALALACLALATGCMRRRTGATLQDRSTPPTFRLLGNGHRTKLVVYGPYPDQQSLATNFAIPAVWSINTEGATEAMPSEKLPPVQYGTQPVGFKQYGGPNPPHALELGKYYKMVVSATHGDKFYKNGHKYDRFELTDVCFTVAASGTSLVPCKVK